MTLQEIKERIAVYESKWGKLGHTNIMKPENEIQHSSLNERRNTMIKTTNDFYKFRQKVAIGKEANKLAHKATISPEELNERNFQNQIDNNTLIHASRNGNEREVHKYYRKEEINGKPRYFYSQEEYDAFKNNKNAAGSAGSAAGELLKNVAKEAWMDQKGYQKRSEASKGVKQREMEESKRKSDALDNYNNNSKDDSIRAIVEVSKNGGGKAAASAFTETPAWKNGLEIYKYVIDQGYDPRTISSNQTKSLGKDFNDFVKQIEDETNEYVKALPKDMQKDFIDECRKLSEKELNKLTKKETVLESVGNKLGEDLSKPITKNVKHSAFDEEDETPSYKTATDLRQEREESIMSEYRAFKARANKGAEKNRLSHSAVISPRDLNAKYEEELAKEYIAIHPENDDFESLSHSGQNFKYYNKIDLPNGNTRYFYTKAEWDAYQDGLGQTKKQEQEKIVKKNADAAAHEGDRYAKKPLPKSATMTDEERKEMYEGLVKKAKIHNQQIKNYENNKEAAKHEGDRYLKKIDDTLKKIDAPLKDVENKPQPIVPEITKVEVEVETPNNANNKEADVINVRNSIGNSQEAHDYAYLIAWQSLYGPDSLTSEGQKIVNDNMNYLTNELNNLYNNAEAKYGAGAGEEFVNVANGKIDELINMYYTQLVAEWNNEINRQQQEIINQQNMWNMMMQSSFDDENDENSLSHNSNGYGGTYLHKLDDFYGPGKPRYFYSEADWNAYQEGLKRNNYNADKAAEAKQAKTDKQKADLARRSGMENYTKYQENKKADEEADARQAKIDEQKTRAKQKAGMEGYEEWNEKRQAEKEANAKKVAEDRNDMSGYAAWKRRRDYINNQKKASEAAEAKEAEKHEIERKAVKNSVEVTKNKAAAKAQEDAESAKRLAEERAANAKKDAASKEAAMKAGQKSTMQEAENAARDKEHKADKEKAKWNNLNNNVTSILEKASKKYDNQLEALNREYESIKDKSSPEAKAVKDKISQTNTKKDAELDKEIMTVVKDLGEIFNDLEDKNGPEAKLLKAQARRALDYSTNTKLAEVMGETNSWINAGMKHPKEV